MQHEANNVPIIPEHNHNEVLVTVTPQLHEVMLPSLLPPIGTDAGNDAIMDDVLLNDAMNDALLTMEDRNDVDEDESLVKLPKYNNHKPPVSDY